ncbi:MAG: translation initiation factor 2 [Symbiobacteriia bacterium]
MTEPSEIAVLQARVRALEEKVQALRASRRVLMSLVTVQERAARAKISRLEQENKRLQQRNQRFAQAMWQQNTRLQPEAHALPAASADRTGEGSV